MFQLTVHIRHSTSRHRIKGIISTYGGEDAAAAGAVVLESVMRILPYRGPEVKITAESLRILESGGIVAYATESYYALGAMATNEEAVKRLFALKKRPADKPLPVIISDLNVLSSIVKVIPSPANDLIVRFWPGPLTLIFEAEDNIPVLLTGNTGRVAARIPGRSAALDLVKALKMPITATSANLSEKPPAVDTDAIIDYFGDDVDLIIDSGKSPGGSPSTIVDVTVSPPKILRRGSVIPCL